MVGARGATNIPMDQLSPSETPPVPPPAPVPKERAVEPARDPRGSPLSVIILPESDSHIFADPPDEVLAVGEGEDSDTDTETDSTLVLMEPLNPFQWLEKDAYIKLKLGGTYWAPRIEMKAVPSGRQYYHAACAKTEEKSDRPNPDQLLFHLLNSNEEPLLAIDYNKELKTFYLMEPDSQRFLAFFTVPSFPFDEHEMISRVYIHNVVDGEMYVVDPIAPDTSIPIKKENGEELAQIIEPPLTAHANQTTLMRLHFTGDDGEGVTTCRKRAILLGFFLGLAIHGISRNSWLTLAKYGVSAILGTFLLVIIFAAFFNDKF